MASVQRTTPTPTTMTITAQPGPRVDHVATARFEAAKARMVEELAKVPPGAPVRLGKRTSNLFRPRAPAQRRLPVDGLEGVLAVDTASRTADVLGMTTYEHLADATLPAGLMPLVVPQLKTITLGGAVTGLGIEATSFRNGLPHESVLEMEILTGNGDIVVARPDNEHAELFTAFPNSYGTLGYALRLRIELERVRPFVRLRHLRFSSPEECCEALERLSTDRTVEGDQVDFLDGTVFALDELYLTVGTFTDDAPATSDYTGTAVYYRSIPQREVDHLTVRDYLWRWDTDWFWCSRVFGVQHPVVRRLWPKRWLRSDVYWKLVALDRRVRVSNALDRLRGGHGREEIIQDVEIPSDRTAEFLRFLAAETGISPVWLCPLRLRSGLPSWDLYHLDPDTLYVNVGFWSAVPLAAGEADGIHNRRIERAVADLGGRKSLYSTAFYPEEEFWSLYGGDTYWRVKGRYDPAGRLPDLYEKCVGRR
jgi:FAD/FMN-containing dehydrogenase